MTNNSQNLANLAKLAQAEAQKRENLMLERENQYLQNLDKDLKATFNHNLSDQIKIVYAGGAKSIDDLTLVDRLSQGRVDLTYGSSLDIFGGELVKFKDCCEWNNQH